jgi:hypothetical protein
MEKDNCRRGFLKYLFSFLAFGIASIFSFRISKNEGFKIGKRIEPVAPPEASGMCGAVGSCAGGGGMCGAVGSCGGGGGMCGAVGSCAGR